RRKEAYPISRLGWKNSYNAAAAEKREESCSRSRRSRSQTPVSKRPGIRGGKILGILDLRLCGLQLSAITIPWRTCQNVSQLPGRLNTPGGHPRFGNPLSPASQKLRLLPGGETEFRGEAFPNGSLGTRRKSNSGRDNISGDLARRPSHDARRADSSRLAF